MIAERTMNIRIDESEGEVSEEREDRSEEEEEEEELSIERKEDVGLDEVKRSGLSNDIECFKRELTLQLQKTSQQLPREDNNADFQAEATTNKKELKVDDEDEVQSEYNYEELSHKLSKALCKIQSKEAIKPQSFLDRVEYFQKKKEKQLRQKREEKQQEQSKLSIKPSLTNAHSQKILQEYQPIQNRYQRILQQKRKKLQRQKEDKRIKEQKEIQEHIKQIPKKQSVRSTEQFISSINSWRQKREKKIVAQVQQEIKSEMEGVTFQPAINTKSKIMAKRIGKVPIYQQPIKAKKIEIDKSCTFTPNLTKPKK